MDPGKVALHIAWIMLVSIVWCHIGTDQQIVEETPDVNSNKTESSASPESEPLASASRQTTDRLHETQKHTNEPSTEEDTTFPVTLATVAPATPHADDVKSIALFDSVSLSSASLEKSLPLSSPQSPLEQLSIDLDKVDVIQFDTALTRTSDIVLSSDIHFLEKCKKNEEDNSGMASSKEGMTQEREIDGMKEATGHTPVEESVPVTLSDGTQKSSVGGEEKEGEQLQSYLEWVEEREKIEKSSQPIVERIPNRKRKSDKKNYASEDCGAKIASTNAGLARADTVLNENKDSYMLNECTAGQWWFVVELCQRIQLESIETANFELFASSPKQMSIFVSDRVSSDWQFVKQYDVTADGKVQHFEVDHEVYGKYVKIELHGQQGNEHYCTLSLLRVFGTTEFEMLADEDAPVEASDGSEDCIDGNCQDAQSATDTGSVDFLEKAKNAVLSMFGASSSGSAPSETLTSNQSSDLFNQSSESSNVSSVANSSLPLTVNTHENMSSVSDTLTKDAIVIRYEEDDEEDTAADNSTLANRTLLEQYGNANITASFNLLSLPFNCFIAQNSCCWLNNSIRCHHSYISLHPDKTDSIQLIPSTTDVSYTQATSDEPPLALPPVMEPIQDSHDDSKPDSNEAKQVDQRPVIILTGTSTSSSSVEVTIFNSTLSHSTNTGNETSTADSQADTETTTKSAMSQELNRKVELTNPSTAVSAANIDNTTQVSQSSAAAEVSEDATPSKSFSSSDYTPISVSSTASLNPVNLEPSFKLVMESSRLKNESTVSRDIRTQMEATHSSTLEATTSSTDVPIDMPKATSFNNVDSFNDDPTSSVTPPSPSNNGSGIVTNGNNVGLSQGAGKHTPITSGSKESVLVKLKKKISDLETNLNRSMVYLELMSQKYRKNLDEQQKESERKLVNLSKALANTTINMQLMSAAHFKRTKDLELQVHSLTSTVESLQSKTNTLREEMSLLAQSFTLVMALQAIVIVVVLRRCCSTPHNVPCDVPVRRHSEPHQIQRDICHQVRTSNSDSMICQRANGSVLQPSVHAKKKRSKKHSKTDHELLADNVFAFNNLRDDQLSESYPSALRSGASRWLNSGKHLIFDRLAGKLFAPGHPTVRRSRLPVSRRARPQRRFSSMERNCPDEMMPRRLMKRPRSCEPVDANFRSRAN